jgi:sugar (glycoside-pentoside-hexuronide) transporter
MEQKRISMKEILVYSFGLFGLQCIIGYLNSYQAQFYNKTMAGDLAIIGIIMLFAKLISSFADPVIGNLIDKSHFKSGKLRPFILMIVIPFMILTILIFIKVPLRGVALYIYIFITSTLWSIGMSFADIPSSGLLSMLSPDPMERNKIAGISTFIKSIGFSGCYVIVPVICFITKSEGGAIGEKEFLFSAIVISVLGTFLLSLIYFVNKERVPYQSNRTSIKEMFFILKDSKPLRIILFSALLGFGRNMSMAVQMQAAHSLVGTITIFGKQIGGENTIVILGATSAVASVISMIITPLLTKKIGEKKTFIYMALYGLLACSIAYIVYVSGITSLVSMLICLFFVGLMYGPHGFLPLVMVADCVDFYEWKTGKRTEGVHFAVLSLSIKISTALSVASGLIIIGLSGYNAANEVFSVKTKNIVYAAYILLPGIFCLLSMIPILFYKLTGEQKKLITEELTKRHLEMQNSIKTEN